MPPQGSQPPSWRLSQPQEWRLTPPSLEESAERQLLEESAERQLSHLRSRSRSSRRTADAAHERVAPQDLQQENVRGYVKGQAAEVWSNSRGEWLVCVVKDVFPREEVHDWTVQEPNSILVHFEGGNAKLIRERHIPRVLRVLEADVEVPRDGLTMEETRVERRHHRQNSIDAIKRSDDYLKALDIAERVPRVEAVPAHPHELTLGIPPAGKYVSKRNFERFVQIWRMQLKDYVNTHTLPEEAAEVPSPAPTVRDLEFGSEEEPLATTDGSDNASQAPPRGRASTSPPGRPSEVALAAQDAGLALAPAVPALPARRPFAEQPAAFAPEASGGGRFQPPRVQGPFAEHAGTYQKGALVEYHSSTHREWLPATVLNRDQEGRVEIDLKPNTWIPLETQAQLIRPRRVQPQDNRQVATPVRGRRPFHNGAPRVMTPGRMLENYNQYPSRQEVVVMMIDD